MDFLVTLGYPQETMYTAFIRSISLVENLIQHDMSIIQTNRDIVSVFGAIHTKASSPPLY